MGREPNRTSDILEAVALLVVDMQSPFLGTIGDAPDVTRRCAFAVQAARAFGIRVYFTEQVPEKLGPTLPDLKALAPDGRVFPKNSFSALGAPGLLEQLRRAGVYHLLICGIETPICIYQTALHAQDSDFDVTVLSDAVGGRRLHDCRVILESLAAASCHVLPSETVFYSMLGNSGHRAFSTLTELVKHYADAPAEEKPASKPAKTTKKRKSKTAEEPAPVAAIVPAPIVLPEVVVPFETDTPPEVDDSQPDDASDFDEPTAMGFDEESESEDLDDVGTEDRQAPDPSSDSAPRKRGRRRRGGARRRRARERAQNGNPGDPASSGPESSSDVPSPSDSAPPPSPAPDQSAD
ncbi:isochorismatase family protein [Congregicoccus parvus]|uniref:isochorismatase family protein n=1 Tax=Congregicoccus parvus TaxID=3081749 RepID=UPI003FA5FA78